MWVIKRTELEGQFCILIKEFSLHSHGVGISKVES